MEANRPTSCRQHRSKSMLHHSIARIKLKPGWASWPFHHHYTLFLLITLVAVGKFHFRFCFFHFKPLTTWSFVHLFIDSLKQKWFFLSLLLKWLWLANSSSGSKFHFLSPRRLALAWITAARKFSVLQFSVSLSEKNKTISQSLPPGKKILNFSFDSIFCRPPVIPT